VVLMKKKAKFLFIFVFWSVLASSQFMFLAYADPGLASYYPSSVQSAWVDHLCFWFVRWEHIVTDR